MLFLSVGDYAGYDETQPTSSSGGKAVVARIIKKERGHRTLVVVGDGATDMEAVPPAVSPSSFTFHPPPKKIKSLLC